MKFAGKIALVAGGTGGLGRAVSLAFLEEGAEVTVTYRSGSEFSGLQSAAGANARRLTGRQVDVTDENEVKTLVDTILLAQGRLDALVNAVGAYTGGLAPAWELETSGMDRMMTLQFSFLLDLGPRRWPTPWFHVGKVRL